MTANITETTPARTNHPELDPVTAQVVRSRLVAITDQMRIALQSVSGSPTVTEASDFFTGLYLPDGSFATMGHQVTFEAPPVGALIRHLHSKEWSFQDGDRIIGNDPFIGALHQNDVQMCAPLIIDGELVAWAGVMAHETDMGGMDFASWSPKAKEVWQEGLRIPAVKLVDGGELREDVLDMILAATRLPAQVGLDVRAFIATLNVASERLRELCHRYGTTAVQTVMASMVNAGEDSMRSRLATIPDGTVHVRDFLEHDGHTDTLYMVDLVATKSGDEITLDFSGSSPQAQGFVNCSRAGLMGGVAGALIPTLGFGMAWNDGLLRPINVESPDGLICTAVAPAPVGSATVETIWVVSNVVSAALNRLLLATPELSHRAQGVNSGTMSTFNLSGINRQGEKFGLHLMDPLAGGFGAFVDHDGQDAAGPINAPVPSIADVEVNEQKTPLVYHYRRLAPDTGGAGRRRGGVSAEVALSVSIPEAEALVMTHGVEVPNSTGLPGGLPGGSVRQSFSPGYLEIAGAQQALAADDTALAKFTDLGSKPGAFTMRDTDVFAVTWQGGGGVGDPLDRDPDAVLADVQRGVVSLQAATEVYGVKFIPQATHDEAAHSQANSVDHDATVLYRHQRRADRLGVAPVQLPGAPSTVGPDVPPADMGDDERWLALSDHLRVVTDGTGHGRVQTLAGSVLCTDSTRWREGAVRIAVELPSRVGYALHRDLQSTGWVCPTSGVLLAVDIHLAAEDPLHDVQLHLNSPNIIELATSAKEK